MAESVSILTKLAAVPGLILAYGFEKLITLVQGRDTFLDKNDFAWVHTLEENWQGIQKELHQVLEGHQYIPEFKEVSVELAEGISQGTSWKTFFLYAYGHQDEENCQRCPETTRLLAQIPGMKTAFFSIMAADTRVTPHRGPYKGVLRYHLGLMVPRDFEKCGIRVGDDIRHWQNGESLVFDDTHEHEAWNDSDETRVVLFVDFLRQLPGPMDRINRSIVDMIGASPFIQKVVTNLKDLKGKPQTHP